MMSRIVRAVGVLFLLLIAVPSVAHAQYNSSNYSVDEIFIGGGGELDSCSTSYCSDQVVGGLGVGDVDSANYRAQGGFGTPSEPTLEVNVAGTSIDLGVLNSSGTAADTATFSILNYISNGYVVRIYGDPPTNISGPVTSTLDPINSPSLSTPGTEQFGINLVGNSSPGIGTGPSQAPDSSFAFGYAAPGYNTSDYFKYVDGDVIAQSDEESGETNYTMSIIANISTNTPGGQYVTTLVVQAIATF